MKLKQLKFVARSRRAYLIDTKYERDVKRVMSFSVPGARFSPAFREGRWDGRINMMQNHAASIGLLRAPTIRKELEEKGYKVRLIKWTDRPSYIKREGFTEAVEKYSYQNDCVKAMLKAIPFGGGLVLSATASGKTKIAAQFASWVNSPILFVVDQIDLLYQSAKEIEDWLKLPVGVVGNSKFLPSDRVTIGTIQTLFKHRKDTLFRRWLKTIKIVIIDEIHVQMARSNFSVVNLIRPEAVFGLTATLQLKKKDVRMKAYSICGPVIFEFSVKEGMDKNVLTRGVAVQVSVASDLIEEMQPLPKGTPMNIRMRVQSDNYDKAVVHNVCTNKAIADFVSYAVGKGYYCVVLVERLKHLHKLAKMFKLRGVDAELCYGAVGTEERKAVRGRFEKGDGRLILANVVFKKGINLKRVDLIVDCAQRSNKNDVLQKLGRGLRLHADKSGLMYFDMVTTPAMVKQSKKRLSALKAAKVTVVKTDYMSAKALLQLGEGTLTKALKGN